MRNNDNNSNNRGSGNRGSQDQGSRGGGSNARNASGDMSVRQAGHMGGQRERELVQEGKQAEGGGSRGRNQGNNDR